MGYFAVIDTETNWIDQVMSIGIVIADTDTFALTDHRYYILSPECDIGGMYEDRMVPDRRIQPIVCSRKVAMHELTQWMEQYDICAMFAYNAAYDHNHLPEFSHLRWYDIMRLAAYRQYNDKIPDCADCFSTGRLKRGYGVESMLRLLSGNFSYRESHNALYDAMDELKIMKLLCYRPDQYIPLPCKK